MLILFSVFNYYCLQQHCDKKIYDLILPKILLSSFASFSVIWFLKKCPRASFAE